MSRNEKSTANTQRQQRSAPRKQKILTEWEVEQDDQGQYFTGLLYENNEKKEWETNYLTKVVLHRQYIEGFTDSGSVYVMEYKNAKSGGHTLYIQ